ncbi:MAG: hypothetical protein H5T62_06040 [Anaerolineae bacterium]|nr:hypothetical protein [Anaerolineae bacterium]
MLLKQRMNEPRGKRSASRRELRNSVVIFLMLLSCYGYFFPRWAEWNQNSRMDLTLAIVEQGTFVIDDYYENTGDYAVYGGHIYTDKAPGTSFLGVPAYAAFRLLAQTPPAQFALRKLTTSNALQETLREGGTGLLEEKVYFAAALYFTTFFTVALASALLGVLLYRFLGRITLDSGQPLWLPLRLLLVLGYGLGTIVFPYSTVFYGHQIAAATLFAAFVVLYRIRHGEMGVNWLWLVGALVGLTVLVEFPALVASALLGLYALWFLPRKRDLVKLIGGGLSFALLLGFYNYSCFGSPFASSYRYLGRFPEISRTGFLGFHMPKWGALWGITFSPYRGLFVLSPFLLLALPGFWTFIRDRDWRAEGVLSVGIVGAQLLLISCWYDWRGGFAIGPRNLLLVLPFFLLGVAFFLRAWGERLWARVLFGGLLLVSFFVTGIASTSGQAFPPITIANPLVEFFWPHFIAGHITRNLGMALGLRAWWSLLPLVLFVILSAIWLSGNRTKPDVRS